MKTTLCVAVIVGMLAGVGGRLLLRSDGLAAGLEKSALSAPPDRVSANGIVEGARPEISLRPETPGLLKVLNVRENAVVHRGQVLAEIANETQKAQVDLSRAELVSAQQQLERLKNGERIEKRQALAAKEAARKALYDQVRKDWERIAQSPSAVSREQRDAYYFRMLQAKAEFEEAQADHKLVEAPPRPEDLAIHQSLVAKASGPAEHRPGRTGQDAPDGADGWRYPANPGRAGGKHLARQRQRRTDPDHGRPVPAARAGLRRGTRRGTGRDGTKRGYSCGWDPGQDIHRKGECGPARMGKRGPQTEAPDNQYRDVFYREVLIDLDGNEPLPTNLRVQVRITVPAKENP